MLLVDERAWRAGFRPGGWLHTVLHNRCLDELRRPGAVGVIDEDALACAGAGPLEVGVLRADVDWVLEALGALPARQREALVRHVLDGQPHQLVAREMQVSVGATKNLVNRARAELRLEQAA